MSHSALYRKGAIPVIIMSISGNSYLPCRSAKKRKGVIMDNCLLKVGIKVGTIQVDLSSRKNSLYLIQRGHLITH